MCAWEVVIGLEVHVQLKTASKMFCGCSTAFGDPPNTNVCPVCLGLPGALPVPNEAAVAFAVRTALALECTIHLRSRFARKNYFYPDLPKGYQISQYEEPLATDGRLDIESPTRGSVHIRVQRLHLEEDAGKSLHDRFPNETAVDLNRAGVPLIEVVSAPDFRSPEEARVYLGFLKQLVEYLGVSDGNMEQGSLRVDANLSVRREGDWRLGTKTEIKNMNSFSSVEGALGAERARQVQVLESGGTVVQQTLLFEPAGSAVRPMRAKEESHDYRYFPEPDLPPLILTSAFIEAERVGMPELPWARRQRFFSELKLPSYDAQVLTATRALADYFETAVASGVDPKPAANWVMGDVLADAKQHNGALRVPPESLAGLIQLVESGMISRQAGKRVLAELAEADGDPESVARRLGLVQVSDDQVLRGWVEGVLEACPDEVRRYRAGETKLLDYFIGRVMKASQGKADPKAVQALLRSRL